MKDNNCITIKLRLKDRHSSDLNRQARSVNTVWNYINEVQQKAVRARRNWMSAYDLQKLTAGSSKLLGLHAHTIQRVCKQYDTSRKVNNKAWLRWRTKRSLGWIPFNKGHVVFKDGFFVFNGNKYKTMHGRDLISQNDRFLAGSFSQDAKERWYINLPMMITPKERNFSKAVGIDLGLKDLATTSDNYTIPAMQFYRKSEITLGVLQRAKKTKRTQAIHRKVANRRKDFLHKQANAIVRQYGTIIVGDVSPSKLTKTRMAKSVNDASWATFKNMLRYKSVMNGGRMIEVNEAYTTQTCSECGTLPAERPRGIAGLGIREWSCGDCGAVHSRDVNAARNILRIGLDTLAEGIAA